MTHEQIIKSLKTLAARLAPSIWFRYLTMEWNDVTNCPVIKTWENKPSYEHGWDDYDYEWEGWKPEDEDEIFVCMINAECLTGTSIGALPKDTDWSKLIISNENREI